MSEEKEMPATDGMMEKEFDPSVLGLPEQNTPSIDDVPDQAALDEAMPKANPTEAMKEAFKSLDIPVDITINGKIFQATQRPIGYINLIINECVNLTKSLESIASMFNGNKQFVDNDGNKLPFSSNEVMQFFSDNKSSTFKSAIRICQLILQPIDPEKPKAPLDDEFILKADFAEWNLTAGKFVELLLLFYTRDILATGYNIKNVFGLSQ